MGWGGCSEAGLFITTPVWETVNVERNGRQIFLQDLLPELKDLDEKLDVLYKGITPSKASTILRSCRPPART